MRTTSACSRLAVRRRRSSVWKRTTGRSRSSRAASRTRAARARSIEGSALALPSSAKNSSRFGNCALISELYIDRRAVAGDLAHDAEELAEAARAAASAASSSSASFASFASNCAESCLLRASAASRARCASASSCGLLVAAGEELLLARRVRLRLRARARCASARAARRGCSAARRAARARAARGTSASSDRAAGAHHDFASFGAGTGTISISGARSFLATATPSLKACA